MTPVLVFRRLLGCFFCGVLLGPNLDFLRPLHVRLPLFTQLLICLELLTVWLFALFCICRGDLRMGYFLGMIAGTTLWELCFGRVSAALFGRFWHFAVLPLKISRKFFHNFKNFLFARRKK